MFSFTIISFPPLVMFISKKKTSKGIGNDTTFKINKNGVVADSLLVSRGAKILTIIFYKIMFVVGLVDADKNYKPLEKYIDYFNAKDSLNFSR